MLKYGLLLVFLICLTACESTSEPPPTEKPAQTQKNYSFTTPIRQLRDMKKELENQENEKAVESFWEVHPFFHDIDPVLRKKDPVLADELWMTVAAIEIEVERKPIDSLTLSTYTTHLIDVTKQAETKIGIKN